MSIDVPIQSNQLKIGETLNAIKILSNAILIGIQKSVDRYGETNNVPPSLRLRLISEVQKGGVGLMDGINAANTAYELKKQGTEKMAQLNQLKSKKLAELNQLKSEKLKEIGQKVGLSESDLDRINSSDNPDNEKGIVSLIASKTFTNAKTLSVAFIKKIIITSDYFASKIIDYVTQDTLNIPVNELTAKTNTRVLALAIYLRAIANDPQQLQAISEISEALGTIGIEFIDSMRPAIDKMVDKLSETSERVASQASSGAMKTFVAIASSLIAEIPGLGGVIDMIISIAIGFNSFMRVVRTLVTNNSELAVYGAEALNKSIEGVKKGTAKLNEGINKLKMNIPTTAPSPQLIRSTPMSGGYHTQKSNSNRMYKSRKRIENSVLRFKLLNNNNNRRNYLHHSRTKKYIHY